MFVSSIFSTELQVFLSFFKVILLNVKAMFLILAHLCQCVPIDHILFDTLHFNHSQVFTLYRPFWKSNVIAR